MQPKLKVEKARTDDLVPYARNAKLHSKKQVGEIANSIEAFGFNDPIGVWTRPDGQLEIVEGHGRVMAAKLLGIEEVPIIRLDHLDDDGRRAYTHVHNQTTLTSGFDMPTLDLDLEDIPGFDWSDFGFGSDWFADRERFDDSRQEGNDEYNEWLDKFEPKKTTDDCYTPDKVYEAVADWTAETYGVDRSSFIRPFYPGGDYQREEYPAGCVVVDNPPFSILAEILRFYVEKGIRFFLFAPTLTLFSGRGLDLCYLPIGVAVTYENGASVNTSFITNLEQGLRIHTIPALYDRLKKANDESLREQKGELPNYEYPPELVTAASLSRYSVHGVDFKVAPEELERVTALDAQKAHGKAIFGGGFLLSNEATRRNIAAMEQKELNIRDAELERMRKVVEGETSVEDLDGGIIVWQLSERERAIVDSLG